MISAISNLTARWSEESLEKLEKVESRFFKNYDVKYTSEYVPIRFKNSRIYTVKVESANEVPEDNPAVVFMHGFGAGVAFWCANLNEIAKSHRVYAFDLLGFGRSSRPIFSSESAIAELEMVEAIEDWRKAMNIEKMVIVGHDFGGYMASAYSIENSQHVAHLILVDPWGFAEKVEAGEKLIKPYQWMSLLGEYIGKSMNPLTPMRWMGKDAPFIIRKLRPDLMLRFKGTKTDDIYKYVYYSNLNTPTGETAFMSMTVPVGWAKRPMVKRFNKIAESVGTTFIFGSKSWIDPGPAMDIQTSRNAYVDIKIIHGAGHHVYADDPDLFNKMVLDIVEGRLEVTTSDCEDDHRCCAWEVA
ncbi:unnamed protein product [Caenorhabditis bovis]|uniref:AB hydrolase-1 domain-containing protein n=1 Tax=Caenorhabditis bovis TaxID=2654633 RepID=A0A8S1F4H8_9PELO|nr:unnamed protein product [Caenorhabditis bovis]